MLKNVLTGLAAAGAGWAAAKAVRRSRRAIDLAGRVVLITGGSRGLGLVLARRFAREGARLVLTARTEEDLARAAAMLRADGAEVLVVPGDVGRAEDAAAVVQAAVERFGRLDVLVNNAGVIQVGPFENMQRRDMEEAMAVHFWGAYHMIEAALPHLRASGAGRIVNIASIGALVAVPHLLPYSASKFALVGYSDGLRAELAPEGLRVMTVCPGLMRTGSPVNAYFKGRHRREYTWFSLSDALPVLSTSAEHAARKIVEACRHGDPTLTITLPAKLAAQGSRLAPDLTAALMALAARLLPAAPGPEGDTRYTGWESFSEQSPSAFTRLSDRAAVRNNELRGHAPPTGR